jgi:hypothetical protein
MPNLIPAKQNSEEQLDLIAASSYFSGRGKLILGFQIFLTVLAPVGWTLIIPFLPKLQLWAAFYSITISIVDAAFFDRWLETLLQQGAKVQELFDCNVMDLPWHATKLGDPIDGESLHRATRKWKRRHSTPKRDWYPTVVGMLPPHLGRLLCQRTNCWYDESLRRRYRSWLTAFLVAILILIVVIGLIGGLTLEKFVLAILAPMSPALLWGMREYKRHTKAIQTRERLKALAERMWDQAITSPTLTLAQESRDLQDEIYDARRTNPRIFNWIYALLREEHEEDMKAGAERLVRQFLTQNPVW